MINTVEVFWEIRTLRADQSLREAHQRNDRGTEGKMKIPLVLLLCTLLLLLQLGSVKNKEHKKNKTQPKQKFHKGHNPIQSHQNQTNKHQPVEVSGHNDSVHQTSTQQNATQQTKLPPTTVAPRIVVPPSPLVSQECLKEKYTRLSCAKVFCLPWQRCIKGQCASKIGYQCPKGNKVCGHNNKNYPSLCHAQAAASRDNTAIFSHYGQCEGVFFKIDLVKLNDKELIHVTNPQINKEDKYLICGTKSWNVAAANVVCRYKNNDDRGAVTANTAQRKDFPVWRSQPLQCLSVKCMGWERTLAECVFSDPQQITPDTHVAVVTCYTNEQEVKECSEFQCVNKKCISWKEVCDGIDECGDYSDEMCCTGCTNGAFLCKSGVCFPRDSYQDQIRDCLGGEDEVGAANPPSTSAVISERRPDGAEMIKEEEPISPNPRKDIKEMRSQIDTQLFCGIPNMDYLNKTEKETRYVRQKRVVGGQEAQPTQIQWQVAVQEDGRIHCGGAYLGGCWVVTAAHCVRPKPQAFLIKFSLWNKLSRISTSDAVPVKNIIIHPEYDSRTYQNDIALIQLEELAGTKECLTPNPAIRSVCVPWSPLQFPPGSTCTISGWGRNKEGDYINTLKWANVDIIGNCTKYYKERFFHGMECAGDLMGSVDTCQGDSGGPLVCTDATGVSYVWGIVSWGEKCGEPDHPGVYTKVAEYFEWIRYHTGWQAVTKYNH